MMNCRIQLGGLVAAIMLLTGCTTEVTLSVPDMMCEDGCAVQVNKILSQQPGVYRVKVDFPNRTATVGVRASQFDSSAAVAELVDHGFENSRLYTSDAILPANAPDDDAHHTQAEH
jgi:copper chaperone CopZ